MDVEQLCRDHGAADVIIKRDLSGLESDDAARRLRRGDRRPDAGRRVRRCRFRRSACATSNRAFRLRLGLYRHRVSSGRFPGCRAGRQALFGRRSRRGDRCRCGPSLTQHSRRRQLTDEPITCVAIASARSRLRPKFQDFLQPAARAADAALDRADRAAADLGCFLIGKARCADQDDRLALVFRKLLERARKSSRSSMPCWPDGRRAGRS